jgi:M6 family metalloprotease-like protein
VVPGLVRLVGVFALLSTIVVGRATAQGKLNPHWEIPGFDFRKDGVLRSRARAVRAMRARLMSAGQFSTLNQSRLAPSGGVPSPSATAVTGVLKVPAILFRYKDSPDSLFTVSDYNDVLFGITPAGAAAGRPYTYRSFYREMSNGVFDIQGATYGYATLDSNEVWYVGGTSATCQQNNPFNSTNCSGLFSNLAITRMQSALREALVKLDSQIDFAQYADTSGFVPLVLFLHQATGAECGPPNAPENHLWAHRFFLTTTYTSQDDDPFHAGQKVKISDYVLQPAVGGASSCTPTQIMPIGTAAHETGHGFGLPDLYDTGGQTEGIGQWGLMSSGSFTSALSPARMEAWSLNELGWVTLAPISTTGTYTFNAAPLSDTAFYVGVSGANPRGEYFLVENRQRQQSDSALIRIHCRQAGNPPNCGGGLLIWHVDSAQLAQGAGSNAVNAGPIHGLALVQADNFRNLDAAPSGVNCPSMSIAIGCSDRGDAGDLYPGVTANPAFVFRTLPAELKNYDASFGGFGIDSVQQLVVDNTLSFRLRVGSLTVVRASDTTAVIQFLGASYNVYRDLLNDGASYAVSFQDGQLSASGRTRFHFQSWSDGLAISHNYSGSVAGGTLTANVARDFKLIATATSGGTIQADTAIDLSGTFIAEGRAVTLTATPNSGVNFGGWSGDTVTTNSVLMLPMGRPYTVIASFGTLLIASPAARPNGVMGASYLDSLKTSGGTGVNNWSITAGALPQGLTLDGPSGAITGYPHQSGNFTYTATVTSGAQTQSKVFTMSVSAPTLATADVVTQLLGPGAPLNADQLRYLDFLGNNNSVFDVGDFLAWVKATGAPLSAAMMDALQKKGGRP